MLELDSLVSPLILKCQSISHIYATHAKDIGFSRSTIYKYIDKQVFTARNIDLPRKIKYKPRKIRSGSKPSNRAYRTGRTYDDFTKLLKDNPDIQIVDIDTVEGQKGGKVLLTLLFRNSTFMLAFIMDEKNQKCVNEVFDSLVQKVGI